GRLVHQRKLHRHIDENAPLKIVRLDERLDDVEQRAKLPEGRVAAALSNHVSKRGLEPEGLQLQGRQHQVVIAFEMLVARRLADADVPKNLVDPDVAKAVAVETPDGRFDQALPGGGGHGVSKRSWPFFGTEPSSDEKSLSSAGADVQPGCG